MLLYTDMKSFLVLFMFTVVSGIILLSILYPLLIQDGGGVSDNKSALKSTPLLDPIVDEPVISGPFYGINVEMGQILPDSKNYVVNDDGKDLIDLASELNINLFRITNEVFPFKKSNTYTNTQWRTVLDKMSKKGIKAIILIESPTIYQKDIPDSYLGFTKRYIIDSGVLYHRAVYAIDLYNEMLINERNIDLLQRAANMIKEQSPETLLTVGWWAVDSGDFNEEGEPVYIWDNYAAGKELEPFVDFHSLHMYGMDKKQLGFYPDPNMFTKKFIDNVKSGLSTDKPLLIGEFGAANGEAISDQKTTGSRELQAEVYRGVFQALKDLNDPQIIGTAAFQFISRTQKADAWAIVKDNGNELFPAAYEIQLAGKRNEQ